MNQWHIISDWSVTYPMTVVSTWFNRNQAGCFLSQCGKGAGLPKMSAHMQKIVYICWLFRRSELCLKQPNWVAFGTVQHKTIRWLFRQIRCIGMGFNEF